jgi:hypothetical protein
MPINPRAITFGRRQRPECVPSGAAFEQRGEPAGHLFGACEEVREGRLGAAGGAPGQHRHTRAIAADEVVHLAHEGQLLDGVQLVIRRNSWPPRESAYPRSNASPPGLPWTGCTFCVHHSRGPLFSIRKASRFLIAGPS